MTIEQEISALNKIVNSGLILSVYTDVDHIDVSIAGEHQPYLIFKIYLKVNPESEDSLYEMVDPLYLIDFHVRRTITKLIPFSELPIKQDNYQAIIYNADGDVIFDWEENLSKMKPGSSGRTDWERRQQR
jgi:hypothetical protein